MEEAKAIVEALIFASDVPLSADRIGELLPGSEKGDK